MRSWTRPWALGLGIGLLAAGSALPALAQTADSADGGDDSSLRVKADSGQPQPPANASQVDRESIEKSGGVGRDNAAFTDGGAQTPVDQRPNALSFDQLDVDNDGVIDRDEAVSANQQALFERLADPEAGGITHQRFREAMGSDTLAPTE
ncbi:hypothetical protein [Salinicola sp. DM10]|uniref:hypothetical protein n=1 Tax=Salinicola sp. DM10 TaxID=2815721 RepID=UPI001A8EA9C0|nr:hypothetical protein [Salinicola sp. DM10]MCE3026092.1 hypothetical protein [Salinicola sp. DM10]